jgi:hypothetical protein
MRTIILLKDCSLDAPQRQIPTEARGSYEKATLTDSNASGSRLTYSDIDCNRKDSPRPFDRYTKLLVSRRRTVLTTFFVEFVLWSAPRTVNLIHNFTWSDLYLNGQLSRTRMTPRIRSSRSSLSSVYQTHAL